jgi:hypothetical protein
VRNLGSARDSSSGGYAEWVVTVRDDAGWQITQMGLQFLGSLEPLLPADHYQEQQLESNAAVASPTMIPGQPALRLVVDNMRASSGTFARVTSVGLPLPRLGFR